MAGDFQDFIDEVLEKTDIVDLVSPYAKLKRVGNRFQCLCPLHNDKKTPSFSISPDKQLFHCFGCGAGGNAIHFVMAKEGLDLPSGRTFRFRTREAQAGSLRQSTTKRSVCMKSIR